MTPSEQLIERARADCDALLAAHGHILRPFVAVRVRPGVPGAAEAAMRDYRETIVKHAICWLRNALATCPDDTSEESAMSLLYSLIEGIPTDRLNDIANLAIHPPLAMMH